MYAVIFEVEPAPGRRQDYLDIAAQLRPEQQSAPCRRTGRGRSSVGAWECVRAATGR